MAGLVPAIHALVSARKTWMPGTRPGMTSQTLRPLALLLLKPGFLEERGPAFHLVGNEPVERRHVGVHRQEQVAFEPLLGLRRLQGSPDLLIEPLDHRGRKVLRPGEPGPDRAADLRMTEL